MLMNRLEKVVGVAPLTGMDGPEFHPVHVLEIHPKTLNVFKMLNVLKTFRPENLHNQQDDEKKNHSIALIDWPHKPRSA